MIPASSRNIILLHHTVSENRFQPGICYSRQLKRFHQQLSLISNPSLLFFVLLWLKVFAAWANFTGGNFHGIDG
jgi:hypothetical protein